MKQPGKAIEVKDEIKALLARHGFARRGHDGGELTYDRAFFGEARLSVRARYRSRDDDEWENSFRLELDLRSPAMAAEITSADGRLFTEQELRRRLAFVCDTVEELARRFSHNWLPPATGETLSGFDGDWTPPGLYNDRMSGEDQIALEEAVAAMIHSGAAGHVTEGRAAELGRRIVLTLLYRARPDLFRDGQIDVFKLLPVSQPDARTAIVELSFSDPVADDLRLAENIAEALRHECLSGNGLMHEAGEGYTQRLRVRVNSGYATREL